MLVSVEVVLVSVLEAVTEVGPCGACNLLATRTCFRASYLAVIWSTRSCKRISLADRLFPEEGGPLRACRYSIDALRCTLGTVTSIVVKSNDVFVVVTEVSLSSVVRIVDRDAILSVA